MTDEKPTIEIQPLAFQPIAVVKEEPLPVEPQVPIKKYYGRRKEDLSSDDEMNIDDNDQSMDTSQQR